MSTSTYVGRYFGFVTGTPDSDLVMRLVNEGAGERGRFVHEPVGPGSGYMVRDTRLDRDLYNSRVGPYEGCFVPDPVRRPSTKVFDRWCDQHKIPRRLRRYGWFTIVDPG